MKKASNIIGYITAFLIVVTAIFKFEHLPGAGFLLCLTGLILGIYFPVFIIDKMRKKTNSIALSSIPAAISSSLISFGIVFRLWHWPGASILFTLGFACFSLVFIPMLYQQRSKETPGNLVINIAGAIGLASFGLGILFKLMHWPGSLLLLSVCPLLLFLIYFPTYMMSALVSTDKKHKYLRNSFFIIIIGTLVALYFIKSIEIHDMDNIHEKELHNSLDINNEL